MWHEEHKTVLGEKPTMTGCCKAPTIKGYLVWTKITNRDTKESKSALSNGKRCQVCQQIEKNCEFEEADGNKYDKQLLFLKYVGSNITHFRYQFNNCKSAFRKVPKSCKPPKVNQEHFHQYFKLPEHNGMDDWRVTLIDRADNRKELRRRKSFWQYKPKIFFPLRDKRKEHTSRV